MLVVAQCRIATSLKAKIAIAMALHTAPSHRFNHPPIPVRMKSGPPTGSGAVAVTVHLVAGQRRDGILRGARKSAGVG